ncbi:MAG TPA: hypothetical protein PLJ46_05310 [Burkholderiaceae bacterium]|nr:hypothetical protein [Burkholderiaceae bacterium]
MSEAIRYPSMLRGALATALVVCSMQAFAADSAASQAEQRYRQDLAFCNSGKSTQSAETCRREAHSARQEARRGGLDSDSTSFADNARLRCAAHEGLDKSACEARMRGEGETEGSVGAGGVLRKSVIVVPGS